MRTIQIVNHSTVCAPACLEIGIAAVQDQIDHDFGPIWGRQAVLTVATSYDPTKETIIIADHTDQADALGYHQVADNTGVPLGFVFAKTAQDYGVPWTVTFSHEMLEQLEDPFVDIAKVGTWEQRLAIIADEVCDPVENDSYNIGNVTVSNFVLPAWFNASAKVGTQVDFQGLLAHPCTLRPGGYISVSYNLRRWQAVYASAGKVNAYRRCPKIAMYSRKRRRGLAKAA